MLHEIFITPLNCGFDEGTSNFITFDEEAYKSTTSGRRILCKDPYESYFKFKDVTSSGYLEPALFGLKPGDTIIVDFDIAVISGSTKMDDFWMGVFKIDQGLTTSGAPLEIHGITNRVSSAFSHHTIPYVIRENVGNGDGILLNIRCWNGIPREYILKNLKITVDTKNPNFGLCNNIVDYKNKKDFMYMINVVSGTSLSGAPFVGTQKCYDEGIITYSDGAYHVNKPAGTWGGLVGVLPINGYANNICVYMEYKINEGNGARAIYNQPWTTLDTRHGAEKQIPIPETGDKYIKHIVYIKGSYGDLAYDILNFGSLTYDLRVSVKRFIISAPRFDDAMNKKPFGLTDLYPNMRFNK